MPGWQRVLAVLCFCALGGMISSLVSLGCFGLLRLIFFLTGGPPIGSVVGSLLLGASAGCLMTLGVLVKWPAFRPWVDE